MKEYQINRQFKDPSAQEGLRATPPTEELLDRRQSDVMHAVEIFEYRRQRRLTKITRRKNRKEVSNMSAERQGDNSPDSYISVSEALAAYEQRPDRIQTNSSWVGKIHSGSDGPVLARELAPWTDPNYVPSTPVKTEGLKQD